MSEKIASVDSPTISPNSPIVKQTNKKVTPKKKKNPPTDNQVQTRGHIKQSELVKWTVFVRPEVKIAVQKAAKKGGITDTAWLDNALWEGATADLSKKVQPPAKVEDVADLIKGFAEQMQANQEAARKAQDDLIQQQGQTIEELKKTVEAVANKPQPSIVQMIFGKSQKG